MPVCIAGMHRSGTSLIARMLNECGLDLGQKADWLDPKPDNPDGYWENAKFMERNDQVLSELGGAWDCPPLIFNGSNNESPDREFAARVSEESRVKARRLVDEFAGSGEWGWKDPRNSLTLPFWKGLLPDMKIAICVRNPLEVALSLYHRNRFSFPLGLQLWLTYNQRALAAAPPERRIITHFDAYFHDRPQVELRRVLAFLGLPASDEVIGQSCALASTAKRHNRFRLEHLFDADVWTEVIRLYVEMCAEAGWLDGRRLESEISGGSQPAINKLIERLDRRTIRAPLAATSDGSANGQRPQSRRLNEELLLKRFLESELSSRQRQVETYESSNQQLQVTIEEQRVALERLNEELTRRNGAIRELQESMVAAREDLEAVRGTSEAHARQLGLIDITGVDLRQAVDTIRRDRGRHDEAVQTARVLRRELADLRYQLLVARIRHLVHTTVPPTATVIVVSKGDPDLLDLDGRQGWHFPQREDGEYTGFYPRDTSEIIAQLERLRAKGGDFLLFPHTAAWWLERYDGLKQYLDGRYRMIVKNDETCSIYALSSSVQIPGSPR